jgi:3-methyl-2-oxobutanoate hydroxymethyltransferase
VTLARLADMRQQKIPITVLTAYDYPTGQRCERGGIDICLVGDSLAQVCLGYNGTTSLTLDEMLHHCRAVARGCKTPHLVVDMPFGTYHISVKDAIRNAVRLIQYGNAESVKLEGGLDVVPIVKALTSVGIPVMSHIGLMPQRAAALSGYRVQGRDAESALSLVSAAAALQKAGAYALVLEAIPHQLATYITDSISIPTIGIGAGSGCSGQVLVWDDALGNWTGHKAKFVRRFANLGEAAEQGVAGYVQAVRERRFPEREHTYEMHDGEWDKFLALVHNNVSQ